MRINVDADQVNVFASLQMQALRKHATLSSSRIQWMVSSRIADCFGERGEEIDGTEGTNQQSATLSQTTSNEWTRDPTNSL